LRNPVRRKSRISADLTHPERSPQELAELDLVHELGAVMDVLGTVRSRRALRSNPLFRFHEAELQRVLDGFAWSVGRARLPQNKTLGAVAWNIERGKSFDGILELFDHHPAFKAADLVLLTEVDLGMGRSGNRNVAAELAAAHGMDWVFANHYLVLCAGDRGEKHVREPNALGLHGSALLSKVPIRRVASLSLPEYKDKFRDFEKRFGHKRALLVEVELADGPLTVAVVHLDPFCAPAYRAAQMRAVIEGIEQFGGERVLLGGDLNTNTYNLSNRRTTARDAVLKLATHGIRGSVARYMVPQKHRGERRVFDAMDAASLDWATFNDLSASTLTYDLQDPELIEKTLAFLPKPVWRVLERLLASTRFAPLRLDWFAGRGLVAQDAGVIALDAVDSPRDRLSDHQPIHVEVVLS